MRYLISMLILLFVCGCTLEPDSKQDSLTNNAGETLTTNDPLAGIDLNDVYNGFISYVKDVQEKYKNGDIQAEQLGWIESKDIDRYLTLCPVELLWASKVILVVAQAEDINGEDKDYKRWGVIMEKQGAEWVPQSAPRIAYIYSRGYVNGRREKLTNTEIVFSPEENYNPPFDLYKWNYAWPHELLPSTFNNAEIISSPVEPNVNNKGKTKSNWGRPVIIHTSNNTEIELICAKYQKSLSVSTVLILWSDFKQVTIDGKKIWIGHYKNEKNEYNVMHFFVGDVLYQIKQNGKYNQDDCYGIIKQITEFMQSKLTEKESDSTSIEKKLLSVDSLSPEEVNAQIEKLREFIIPPKGASKEDVDAVFGVPEEFYGSLFNKVSPDTLMYKYQLLTPEPRQEFRAYLYVKYNDNKVEYIGISHSRTIGNLYSGGNERQQLIESNNKYTLEDLIEIKEKYKDKLNNASWNK